MARIGPIGRVELSATKDAWPGVRIQHRHRRPPARHHRAALASPAQAISAGKVRVEPRGNTRESAATNRRRAEPSYPRPDGSPILWAMAEETNTRSRPRTKVGNAPSPRVQELGGGIKPRARAESKSQMSQSQEQQPEGKSPAHAHASPRVERTKQELLLHFLILFNQEPMRHPEYARARTARAKCV